MARNKKRTRPMIRIPKDPLGPDRMYISITDEELPQVKRLLGFAGTKGKGGVISFFNPGGGTGGPGDEGALGQMAGSSATGTSPTGSRGPGTQTASSRSNPSGPASSPSRSPSSSSTGTGARGPGTQNASSRSNPSGPAGSPSRGGPPGGGGQNTGGQNTGGRGNEAGGVGAQSGGSGASRSGSVAAGTRGGVTNPGGTQGGAQPAGRTPGGGAQPGSGALGQMARSMAPGTRTPGGGAPPASGMLGQLAGPPRAPGAAMGLLGATRSPQKMQDRIAQTQPDRGPLGPQGQPTGFDPTRPVGRPTEPTFDPLSGILSPSAKAKNRMSQLLGENEVPEAINPYDTTFHYGKPAYGTNFTDIDLTKSTLDQVLDWQSENTYNNPKFGTVQTPAVGITQAKQRTLEEAAKNLGLTGDTVMSPDVWDDINVEIAKMQGIGAWEGLKGKTPEKVQAREDFTEAFEEASQPVGTPFSGVTPNYNDPIWSGQPLEPTNTRLGPGDLTAAAFNEPARTLLGPTQPTEEPTYQDMPRRTFIDTKSNLAMTKPFQDRVPQDPNFNPAADNPSYDPMMGEEPGMFGRIAPALEPAPFQEATPARPNPPFTRNSINSLLGAPTVKTVEDRVPQARYEPSDMSYLMDSAIGRHAVDIADARRAAAEQEQEPPSTRVPGSAAALANYNPAFTPSTRVPGSAAALANYSPAPRLDQDTEPETVPTDITQQGSWPKDLVPSSGMPQGTLRDRLIQDAVAEDEGREPANISPEIPVNVRVKNSVTKQYGPDMAEEILTTVAAIKSAMGYDTKHGQRGGGRRGRGIGQLAMAPKQKRIPLKGTGHATRVIPPRSTFIGDLNNAL